MSHSILVVDDEALVRWSLKERLCRDGHAVREAGTAAAALEQATDVDLVLLDYRLPDSDGLTVLRKLKERQPETLVILMTAFSTVENAVDAMKLGAFHYVNKPFNVDEVALLVEKALETISLRREVKALRSSTGRDYSFDAIIGASQSMVAMKALLKKVAVSPATTVLLTGETGTGKDLAAKAIHYNSDRAGRSFVNITCSALPEQLLESELFGHERGAFTGADRLRRGAFENAGGGTLFLDEVGELSLPAQAKLLRVLEERKVMRVGGDRAIQVTARVVAATNRELERDVEAGRFRQDLYYRLNVHTLRVPPLRERLSDVPALVDHLLRSIAAHLGMRSKTIAPDAVALLAAYDWRRNNVRELRNCLERMMIASDAAVIGAADVPPEMGGEERDEAADATAPPGTLKARKAQAERQIVLVALDKHDWHITRTAEALGLADHSSLLKIMRRHGLSKGMHRDA